MKSNKDVTEKVKTLCEKYGVDFGQFVIGYGKSYDKKKNRYVYDASSQNPASNSKLKYAIKFIADENFYLVWRITERPKRNVFSVSRLDGQTALERNRNSVQKGVEYISWNEESVQILSLGQLEEFIKILSRIGVRKK